MLAMEEFSKISSDDSLDDFIHRHGFNRVQRQTRPQTANSGGGDEGKIEGVSAQITHRWYDLSGPFQNEPDIHKALLEVDGYGHREVAYNGYPINFTRLGCGVKFGKPSLCPIKLRLLVYDDTRHLDSREYS